MTWRKNSSNVYCITIFPRIQRLYAYAAQQKWPPQNLITFFSARENICIQKGEEKNLQPPEKCQRNDKINGFVECILSSIFLASIAAVLVSRRRFSSESMCSSANNTVQYKKMGAVLEGNWNNICFNDSSLSNKKNIIIGFCWKSKSSCAQIACASLLFLRGDLKIWSTIFCSSTSTRMADQTAANLLLARTKGLYMLKGGDFTGHINSCKDHILYFFYTFCIFSEEEESVRTVSRTEKVVQRLLYCCKIVVTDETVLGNDPYGNESKVPLVHGVSSSILFQLKINWYIAGVLDQAIRQLNRLAVGGAVVYADHNEPHFLSECVRV